MTRRWLKRAALAAVGLVGLVIVALGVVVGTSAGTRLLAGLANDASDGVVSIDGAAGTLLTGAEFAAVVVATDGVTLRLQDTRIDLALAALFRGALDIEELRVGALRVDIAPPQASGATSDAAPTVPIAPLPLSLRHLRIDSAEIRSVDAIISASVETALTWTGATVRLTGMAARVADVTVTGRIEIAAAAPLQLAAELSWQTEPPLPVARGDLRANGSIDELTIAHELLAPLQIRSVGGVSLASAAEPVVSFEHTWSQQRLESVGADDIGLGAGSLETRGPLAAVQWRLRTPITQAALSATIDGAGTLNASELTVDQAELQVADVGAITFDGSASWQGGERVARANFAADVAAMPVADLTLPERVSIAGRVEHLSGSGASTTVIDFDGERASDLRGRIRLADGRLTLRGLEAVLGADSVRLDGSLTRADIALEAAVAVTNIGDYWPLGSGRVRGRGTASGALSAPVLSAELVADALTVPSLEASRVELVATSVWPDDADVRVELTDVIGRGRPIGRWVLTYNGAADGHNWAIAGRNDGFQVEAEARGALAAPRRYQLDWRALRVGNAARGIWELDQADAVLTWNDGVVEQSPLCLRGPGSLCVQGQFGDDNGRGSLQLERLPLAPLSNWFAQEIRIDGDLNATLDVRWLDGNASGTVDISVPGAELVPAQTADASERAPLPFSIDINSNLTDSSVAATATLDVSDIGGLQVVADFADVMNPATALSIRADGQFKNIQSIDAWLPLVRIETANARVDVDVSGTADAPVASAVIELTDSTARIAATGTRIGATRMAVNRTRNSDWQVAASSRVGDGTLTLDGAVVWPAPSSWTGQLTLGGENLAIAELPELAVTVTPALTVRRSADVLAVSGDIAVPYARIKPIESPEGAIEPSSDVVIVGGAGDDAAERGVRQQVDIRVVLGDDVRLDGYGLSSAVRGAVRMQGRLPDQVRGFGNVTLIDGRFAAYGQSLTIDQGELLFGGDLTNPGLNLVATRAVQPGLVGVQIAGTVREPVSTLTSSPALPQAETLAWLITGRGVSATDTAQESALSDAAIALGLTRLGSVTGQLRDQLGLDTLSVASDGGDDGQLMAGKWIGERLYLQYAVGIFDKLGSVMVRYQVNKRLRFESRTGTEQSLDLVYSVGRDN